MNYADTNWLEAVYISPHPDDREARSREQIVERFARKHGGQLAVSHIVLLEARNVFSRVTGEAQPSEWEELEADFVGFDIGGEFVVGYGLDYQERYRNLPFVGVLKGEVFEGSLAPEPDRP